MVKIAQGPAQPKINNRKINIVQNSLPSIQDTQKSKALFKLSACVEPIFSCFNENVSVHCAPKVISHRNTLALLALKVYTMLVLHG